MEGFFAWDWVLPITVLKNSKYKEIIQSDKGIWKTKIVLYSTTDSSTVYIDSGGIYIARSGTLVRYKIDEKAQSELQILIDYVEKALK